MFKTLVHLAAGALVALAGAAQAQQQPPVPPLIKIVVPVPPGASNDVLARVVAPQLAARLGTTVIVENRAGASGFIGASAVAKAPRDGSMLLLFSTSLISSGATMRNPPVDVIKDLLPVAGLMEMPLVVAASHSSGIKTPADLLAAARSRPGGLNHAHGAIGGVAHITSELLADAGKFRLNNIAYKGGAPAMVDLAAGITDISIATFSAVDALAKSGRLHLVAGTAPRPTRHHPDLPVLASVLPGFVHGLWIGVWTTPGTPAALVQRYNRELNEIARSKEVQEQVAVEDGSALALTPEQFAARVRESYDRFKRVAAEKQIVVE